MSHEDVLRFVEFLQNKAITNIEEYVDRTPRVTTLRNIVRPDLNYRLLVLQVRVRTFESNSSTVHTVQSASTTFMQ